MKFYNKQYFSQLLVQRVKTAVLPQSLAAVVQALKYESGTGE